MTNQPQPTLQDVINTVTQIGQRLKASEDAMQEMALWRRTAFSLPPGTGPSPTQEAQPQATPAVIGTAQQAPAEPLVPPELTLTFKFWGATYLWNAQGKLTDGHLALAAWELTRYAEKFFQQRYEASQKAKPQ